MIEPRRVPGVGAFKLKRQIPMRGGQVSSMLSFGLPLDDGRWR
jgi:hypothetical protein